MYYYFPHHLKCKMVISLRDIKTLLTWSSSPPPSSSYFKILSLTSSSGSIKSCFWPGVLYPGVSSIPQTSERELGRKRVKTYGYIISKTWLYLITVFKTYDLYSYGWKTCKASSTLLPNPSLTRQKTRQERHPENKVWIVLETSTLQLLSGCTSSVLLSTKMGTITIFIFCFLLLEDSLCVI